MSKGKATEQELQKQLESTIETCRRGGVLVEGFAAESQDELNHTLTELVKGLESIDKAAIALGKNEGTELQIPYEVLASLDAQENSNPDLYTRGVLEGVIQQTRLAHGKSLALQAFHAALDEQLQEAFGAVEGDVKPPQ